MSIPEDTAQTPIPPDAELQALLDAFRRAPADGAAHTRLTRILGEAGRHRELAEVHELYAPHERDRARSATLWTEAARVRLGMNHGQQAERNLGRALDLDPAHPEAAETLAEMLISAGRYAEAAEIVEDELDALKERAEALPERKRKELAARRAGRHRVVAELWGERLGRVDRALDHWQRAWHLQPART